MFVEVRPRDAVGQLGRAVEGDDVVVACQVHVRELFGVGRGRGEGELGAVDVADGVVAEKLVRVFFLKRKKLKE